MNLNTIDTALREMERQIEALRAEIEKARAEKDAFAVLVFQARKEFSWALDNDNKSGKKQIWAVGQSYKKARGLGFRGTQREWVLVLGAVSGEVGSDQ